MANEAYAKLHQVAARLNEEQAAGARWLARVDYATDELWLNARYLCPTARGLRRRVLEIWIGTEFLDDWDALHAMLADAVGRDRETLIRRHSRRHADALQ